MEPEEAFRQPPVYKYDQVITQQDLKDAITVLMGEYQDIPIFYLFERERMSVAIKTLDYLLDWVNHGKPANYEGRI